MLRVVCALQGKASAACPSHLRQTVAAQEWVWNLLSTEEAILHSLSLGSASRLHTAAETGAVCALSDASSPCITETQYPHPGHVASHHLASVSTSDTTAPQHHTAHQLCRVALIQRSKITGFRQYATAERPSSRRRATGHVASQSLSPATPTSSLFPTPHEVLESVTSQQEAGSEIDGTLDGLRQHLTTSQPAASAAWLSLATTKELAQLATILSSHTTASSPSSYGAPTDSAAAAPPLLPLELVARVTLDRATSHLQASSPVPSPASAAPAPHTSSAPVGHPIPVSDLSDTKGPGSNSPSSRLSVRLADSNAAAVQGVSAGTPPQQTAAASARELATLSVALAQGGSCNTGLYLQLGDQLAASRGFTRLGVNQLVNVAAAFAMAGMAHTTLLDAIAAALLPGSAGERHLAAMPQLATLAGAYAQLCYSHRPLLDSIATKFLALSDKWGLEDAEHVASIAAACAQLQLDRPRVYITALTYTTDHAMEMSSASLLKLLRAAAHVTAPHNQGAANADSQLSPLAPALTVSHPHQLHSKTEGGGVFYSVVHPGRPAPVVRSTLDSVVSARSTGASMLDIQLQPAFAANLARFVTKACQLLKHDLPDLGLQELAAVVDSCASLSQLQPADDNEVSHTSVFSPVARGRGSSSSTWDETFGADLEAGSGSDGSERVLEGLAAVRLGGGGINRSTQGSAASSKIRTAAADPVFLQQLEGSAVALVGSHIHGDGTQLPVLAQMLLAFAKLGHTASVLEDATTRLVLHLSSSSPGLSPQPTETVLQLLSSLAWHARSEQQQHAAEDARQQAQDPEQVLIMQALTTELVPRLHLLQPQEVLEVVRAASSQESGASLPPDLLDAIASHVSAQQHQVPAAVSSPLSTDLGSHSSLSPVPAAQHLHSSRKQYTAVQLCNLVQELGPIQGSGEALAATQKRLALILRQQQPTQVQAARPQAQIIRTPLNAVLGAQLVCGVVGVSARHPPQDQVKGGRTNSDTDVLNLLSDHVTAHIHSYSPEALAQMLQVFAQVPDYTNIGLTNALAVPLTRYEAMEDMRSDTWLSTSLALSSLGHRQERTFEILAARGVKLIRAHMPPTQLMDAMSAYTNVNVYSKALFNALCRYCLLQLHLFTPPMMLRLLHHLSDARHKELETVMVLARSVRERLRDFTLEQLMELVAASLRLQVYHGQLYRDIARRYLAEVSTGAYRSSCDGVGRAQWAALHNLVVAYGMSHHKDPEIMAQLASHVHAYLLAQTTTPQAQLQQQQALSHAVAQATPILDRPHCALSNHTSLPDGVHAHLLTGEGIATRELQQQPPEGKCDDTCIDSHSTQAQSDAAALLFAQELAHVVWVISSSKCHSAALMQAAATTLAPLIAQTREQRYAMRIAQAYASVGASTPLVLSALRTRILRILHTANSSLVLDAAASSQEMAFDTTNTTCAPLADSDEASVPNHGVQASGDCTSASEMTDPCSEEPGSLTVSLVAAVGWAHAEAGQMDAELASALACYCSNQAGGLSMEQLSMMTAALAGVSCGFCAHSDPAFPSSQRDAQQAMLAVKEVTRVNSRQVSDAVVAEALSTRLCGMASWDEDFGRVGRSLASRAAAAVQARKSFRRMWQYPKYVF